MRPDGVKPATPVPRRALAIAGAGFGLAAALFAVSVAGSMPAAWHLEFHEQTFEEACALANEPGLELATVWHCQNEGAESYMVRLGPVADRIELDRVRDRYRDRNRFPLILNEDSCKTMERQSCPVGMAK
jgi:hypothetical protein